MATPSVETRRAHQSLAVARTAVAQSFGERGGVPTALAAAPAEHHDIGPGAIWAPKTAVQRVGPPHPAVPLNMRLALHDLDESMRATDRRV